MEDLTYILSLGFSGSDIIRAVIIAFLAAMLVSKNRKPWQLALWALLFDRLLWPISALMINGTQTSTIGDILDGMLQSFSDDLGVYVVRFAGLLVLIMIFHAMRKRIHRPRGDKLKHKNKTAVA